jgi:hypothetical protein
MSEDNESKAKYKFKGKNYEYRSRVGDGGLGWLALSAYVGAAIYFVSQAHGFWEGVLGLLKATVWPAFLVYQALSGTHV